MPDKVDMPQARELAFVESGTPQARAVERGDGDGVQVRILEIRALKPAVLEADIADPRAAEIRFLCPAFP
jgi:hypothetical protein